MLRPPLQVIGKRVRGSATPDTMGTSSSAKSFTYRRRQPEETVLYKTLAANVETFLADRKAEGKPVPDRVAKELRDYLKCGVLQYGLVVSRFSCPDGLMHDGGVAVFSLDYNAGSALAA